MLFVQKHLTTSPTSGSLTGILSCCAPVQSELISIYKSRVVIGDEFILPVASLLVKSIFTSIFQLSVPSTVIVLMIHQQSVNLAVIG
jgi:hypothetical protein